ncbi:MAG: NAD(P)/FAD-dependent oxidoreductase [Candidatus Omnitrophica bacterium]|nr:NAD(P)/FAD-dependent oxidoreductase [Candidatus Omnitrophota bacterium]MCM8821860.1 NAD(P)/FAD-dependent oxidoreductase [Candidatus Omnitrophota bacterium]MCM8828052.1 NAD(P)/FAD-dependent oxidoreductase [Candidatus Omnitrophota bacterium]
MINRLVVIGAGAAGIMASISASNSGKKVLCLDGNSGIGHKLFLAGAGRCNLTSDIPLEEFFQNYHNGDFLRNSFAQFSNTDLMRFFEENGITLDVERGNRVFPATKSSQDIVAFFRNMLEKCRVQLWLRNRVMKIEKLDDGIFKIIAKKAEIFSKSVILATGGKSYPQTGSRGDGYKIARLLGHTIIKPVPVLCGMNLKEDWIKQWQGISLKNVEIKAVKGKNVIGREFGEALFTHYGISGPCVLNLSRVIAEIRNADGIKISIDFKPALEEKMLEKRLISEFQKNSNKSLKNIMKTLLPQNIIDEFLLMAALSGEIRGNQITTQQRSVLVSLLKDFQLTFDSLRGFDQAIVTRGGVSVKEINPKTMESKIVPGLFFAGEIIDVDGKTGGFNLQAAFSTGFVAGKYA